MSKLGNMYQGAKKHSGKIITGALIVGALAGMRGCVKYGGEEVYRGKIGDLDVVYEERRFSGLPDPRLDPFFIGNRRNIMTIADGDKTYTLIDSKSETSMNWKKLEERDLKSDELEGIIKIEDEGENVQGFYYGSKIDEWNPTTIDGRRKKETFEMGNQMYNDIREKIREKLRTQYESQPNPLAELRSQSIKN